jgi:hypothetical protein
MIQQLGKFILGGLWELFAIILFVPVAVLAQLIVACNISHKLAVINL